MGGVPPSPRSFGISKLRSIYGLKSRAAKGYTQNLDSKRLSLPIFKDLLSGWSIVTRWCSEVKEKVQDLSSARGCGQRRSSWACSRCLPASRQIAVNPTNPDHTGARRRRGRRCNPGNMGTATGHTNKGHTTRDPNRNPNSHPSTAIRSRSPSLPSPNHHPSPNHPSPNRHPNRGPDPSHRPNRDRANRLPSHHHADGSPGLRGKLRRRNQARLLTKHPLTGQKSATRHRRVQGCERRGPNSRSLWNCVLHGNARNFVRNYRGCRTSATGHR